MDTMDTTTIRDDIRVTIELDEEYDPSGHDLDWPADEVAEHVARFASGELRAVTADCEVWDSVDWEWRVVGSLSGIEIGDDEPYGPGDVITPADIPLGPADPRRLYGFTDLASVPVNLAIHATASESYLVAIAMDLFTEATGY